MAKYRSPFKKKATITTTFKKPGSWRAGYHTGEDWVCDDRTLVSPADATVSFVGYDENGYGNYIILHTTDKKAILMGHFASKSNKKAGDKVSAGDVVGTMGSTGNSTGPHLHIEVQNSKEWNYGENLLKPSDYIDFNNFSGVDNMKLGDSDNGVFAYKVLLTMLKEYGVISAGVDMNGVFGNGTVEATKQIQTLSGLAVNGVAQADEIRACKKLIDNAEKSSASTIKALNKKINNAKNALK